MNIEKNQIENINQPSNLGNTITSLPLELMEWWEGFRPESWDIIQHLHNPCVNCSTEREQKLAFWISRRLR